MIAPSLYYCWSCDAHRRASESPSGRAHCPRCGQELASDARLKQPATASTLDTDLQIVGRDRMTVGA